MNPTGVALRKMAKESQGTNPPGDAVTLTIEGRPVSTEQNHLDPVTYVPRHANGNAGHKDCEQGVIIEVRADNVMVLYSGGRTVQATKPDDLVWG